MMKYVYKTMTLINGDSYREGGGTAEGSVSIEFIYRGSEEL